jgi:hypothetical protein
MMPPESLKLRVLEAARQRPVPRQKDRLPVTLGLAALAGVAMSAVVQWAPRLFGDVGGMAHAAGRPSAIGAWMLAGTFAVALASTCLVLPFRRSMLAPPRVLLLAVIVAVPVLVAASLMLWHGTYDDPFTRFGWRCFALTALTAPWPFAVLAYASRRLEPRHPGTAGAALGAVAGAWAAAMVELWCPLAAHQHVLIGHVLPIGALALAGSVFGSRIFRLREV